MRAKRVPRPSTIVIVVPSSPTGYASWSGTSFATANFRAAFVTDLVAGSDAVELTGAHLTPGGLDRPPHEGTPPTTVPTGQATTLTTSIYDHRGVHVDYIDDVDDDQLDDDNRGTVMG